MLAAPPCSDPLDSVILVPYANATADTTWVISTVNQSTALAGFGLTANISSLARIEGACAANNASSLGVQTVPAPADGYTFDSCSIEDGAFLLPGANVTFGQNEGFANAGGWALLPASPSYCGGSYGPVGGQCNPDETYDSL